MLLTHLLNFPYFYILFVIIYFAAATAAIDLNTFLFVPSFNFTALKYFIPEGAVLFNLSTIIFSSSSSIKIHLNTLL